MPKDQILPQGSATAPIELILVMPAYNEEECIEDSIDGWHTYLNALFGSLELFRILVINDGSRDQTGILLDELKLRYPSLVVNHQKNAGHGVAVLNGYRMALEMSPKWVFQTDSDNQFRPQNFELLWQKRHTSKFITGFRKHRQDDYNRLVITKILRFLVQLVFQCNIKDSNVPYRLMSTAYLQQLMQQLPSYPFAPNIFLCVMACKQGQRLYEIPIDHLARETGVVSIVKWNLLKVCFRSAKELISFRLSLGKRIRAISV